MSAIHTLDQLGMALDDDLSWRKKELSIIRAFIPANAALVDVQNAAVRSGIAILYAHWEGFVKNAGTFYLEFVGRQYKRFDQLKSNLVALTLRKELESASTSRQMFRMLEVTDQLINGLSDTCRIPWETGIQTKSNLDPQRFKEIVLMLGLDYAPYATKEKLIETKLVNARHTIAHGKYLPYDTDDFELIYREISDILEGFRNQVENAAAVQSYLA